MASKSDPVRARKSRVRKTDVPEAHKAAVRKADPLPYVLPETGDAMLRLQQVREATAFSAGYVWELSGNDSGFPRPIRFGPRCTRWSAAALREWIAKKAAESAANAQPSETVLKAGRISVEKRRAARAAAAAANAAA